MDLAAPERASNRVPTLLAPDTNWYTPPIDNKEYKLSVYLQIIKESYTIQLCLINSNMKYKDGNKKST